MVFCINFRKKTWRKTTFFACRRTDKSRFEVAKCLLNVYADGTQWLGKNAVFFAEKSLCVKQRRREKRGLQRSGSFQNGRPQRGGDGEQMAHVTPMRVL